MKIADLFLGILGISASAGLLIAALLLSAPFLNRRYAARWKYLIWVVLAVRLVVPIGGTDTLLSDGLLSGLPKFPLQKLADSSHGNPADGADGALPPPFRAISPLRAVVEVPEQLTRPIAVRPEKGMGRLAVLDIAALVWMIGASVYLSVHLGSYLHYRRQVMKKGAQIRGAHILRQIGGLCQELGIRRAVRAVEYPEASGPMVIGFLRPVLVMPPMRCSREEFTFILKHELVHLKRGDVYGKLLFVAAGAVHWFNPLVWAMQREAAVDMELACDERVVRGADDAAKRAYTETLLSTLHRQCARRALLSTQFYGGKQVMKRRFRNILNKKRKKNGAVLLACAMLLTVSAGTLAGCSLMRGGAGAADASGEISDGSRVPAGGISGASGQMQGATDSGAEGTAEGTSGSRPESAGGEMSGQGGDSESGRTQAESGQPSSESGAPAEGTKMLTFILEGMEEQEQASLTLGEGYSLYLPDGDGWHLTAPDLWTPSLNEAVSLWAAHFEGRTRESVLQELEKDGYAPDGEGTYRREQTERITCVSLKEYGGGIWGVFYAYPAEGAEGWGVRLPVVADTFALTVQP